MRTIVVRLALCALAFVRGLLGRPLGSTWIELTFPFNNATIYWPGDPTFKLTTTFDNYTSDGYYLFMSVISAPEHGGTHLDAPRHYAKGKWSTAEIPLDRLIGPAIKIDISSKAAENADAQLTPSDLQAWEEKYGMIPDDVILLVFTNWGRHWPNRTAYLGTDAASSSLMHFPGIHPNASRWLVKNRKIKLVGIDTASIDYGQSKFYETHQILYKENIPGLESVANMDKLPAKGFTLYAAPMFITGGSGGPCRIFARLDKNEDKDCIKSGAVRFQGKVMYMGITLPLLVGFLKFFKLLVL